MQAQGPLTTMCLISASVVLTIALASIAWI